MDSGSESGSFWQKITRLFNGKNHDHVEQAIIEASQDGELEAAEGTMLLSILRLDDLQVQDIMIPRTDISAIPGTAPIVDAIKVILSTGHSRLPVYLDHRDNIVGIIYAKDLLRETCQDERHKKPVSDIMHQPFFVPETKNVLELLNEFKTKKIHMAFVLDEYGGTSGLVTIEDVFEEIFGEIEDEHDTPKEADIIENTDGSLTMSGRSYLEDINSALGSNLASEEVDTIGGLLSHIAGRLPQVNEEFILDGIRFIVKQADNKQVYSVLAVSEKVDKK